MKVRINLVIIVTGIFLVGFILTFWRLSIHDQKNSVSQAQNTYSVQSQISAQLVANKIVDTNRRLIESATQELKSRFYSKTYEKTEPQSIRLKGEKFLALSFLVPSHSKKRKWKPLWTSVKTSFASEIKASEIVKMTNQLDIDKMSKNQFLWKLATGSQGRKYIIIGQKITYSLPQDEVVEKTGGEATILAILPKESLSILSKLYKAESGDVYILDKLGEVVASSDAKSVGVEMRTHPLFKLALKGKPVLKSTILTNLSNERVIGYYSEVEGSNLMALTMIPINMVGRAKNPFWLELAMIFLGLALIAFVLFSFFMRGEVLKLAEVLPILEAVSENRPISIVAHHGGMMGKVMALLKNIQSQDNIGGSENEEEVESLRAQIDSTKVLAFRQFGMGLTEALRGPIVSVLGNAQIILGRTEDIEVKRHCEIIQRDMRRSRDVIENLGKFSGAETGNLKFVELRDPVSKALMTRKSDLKKKGIQVHKKLKTSSMVRVNAAQMQSVVEKIIDNAIDSMTWETGLDLFVEVVEREDHVLLVIKDSGKGISKEGQTKILEPFYTTKNKEQNPGLGLTVVVGLIQHFKGNIKFQSKEKVGTQVIIELPLVQSGQVGVERPTTHDQRVENIDSNGKGKEKSEDRPVSEANSDGMKVNIEALDLSAIKGKSHVKSVHTDDEFMSSSSKGVFQGQVASKQKSSNQEGETKSSKGGATSYPNLNQSHAVTRIAGSKEKAAAEAMSSTPSNDQEKIKIRKPKVN